MKTFLLSAMICSLAFLSFNAQAQQPEKSQDSTKKKMKMAKGNAMGDLPYQAMYSSNFGMGKRANAKMILDLYKDYEKNDFSKDSWFSDTVTVFFPDGSMIKGKDSVIAGFKQNRSHLGSVEFIMHAIIPLNALDRQEDWVALWGVQNYTGTDNAQKSEDFQAIWKIDKSKKVAFIKFFSAQSPKMQ